MLSQTDHLEAKTKFIKPKIDIEKLVDTSLPPSPDNVLRISALLRDVNTPSRKISEAIIYEPMLVTLILRLANSAVYAFDRKVTSIDAAVAAVGSKTLLEMVMLSIASTSFAKEIRNSIIARKIWEHSLAVAIISRGLAEKLNIQATDEAFTCGLLHDIGKLILLSYDFPGFSMILSEPDEDQMLMNEQMHFGYNHAEVGSLVARRWGLQEEVCYTIRHHHNPSLSAYPMLIAHIVEVADIIANLNGYGLRSENKEKLAHSESVVRLRLTPQALDDVWRSIQKNIEEVIKTFA